MKKIIATLILASLAFGCKTTNINVEDANAAMEAEAAAQAAQAEADAKEAMKVDIVDTAVASGTFTTLVAALSAAELVEALKAEGPYTVFAPTDEAFAALPAGTVENLLKAENKEELQRLLKFHVIPSRVMAADVATSDAGTLAGVTAQIIVAEDGSVTYQNAKVIKTDIDCTNGVIHVIDAVAIPAK